MPAMPKSAAVRATAAVLVGLVVAVVIAIAASPLFPLGLVRRVEPDPGLRIDGRALGFGALIFHIRVLGSLLSIFLLSAMGAVAFAGLGLLTASRAQKIESVSGLINLIMMPMWIFSGVFFSYERFPAAIHPFIKALPLTALNDALRATILEGAPLTAQAGRLLVLALSKPAEPVSVNRG